MINRPDWWDFAHTTEPDIWLLEQILNSNDYIDYDRNQIKAIQLKYDSMIAVPTLIEKTISPEQLFNVHNPLWARGYTVQELYDWFKYHKPLDGYDRVDAIIKVSEKTKQSD